MSEPFDLAFFLQSFHRWTLSTFGPGRRTAAICDHIRKELRAIEAMPDDRVEWVDVLLLAFNGAMRAGMTADEVCFALQAKHAINCARKWPDWRTSDPAKAIEHVRDE